MSEIVGGAAERYFGGRLLADTLIPLSIVVTQLRSSGFERPSVAPAPRPLQMETVRGWEIRARQGLGMGTGDSALVTSP